MTSETRHVRSFFRDLAAGATFHPGTVKEELRFDSAAMTSADVYRVKDTSGEYARKIKAAREAGEFQRARAIADEAASLVADLIGVDNILPAPESESPRELAARIRRY